MSDDRCIHGWRNAETECLSCALATIADLRAELASFKRAHAEAHECAGDMQALAKEMGVQWGDCVWKAVPLLRAKLAEAERDAERWAAVSDCPQCGVEPIGDKSRRPVCLACYEAREAEARALREALYKFGVHFYPCRYGGTTARVGPQDECTCGLTEALRGKEADRG